MAGNENGGGDGSPTNRCERISQFAWRGFLIVMVPAVIFAVLALVFGSLAELGLINLGTKHKPEPLLSSLNGYPAALFVPIFWVGGILFAHKFGDGVKALIPYLIGIFVVYLILRFLWIRNDFESGRDRWIFLYPVTMWILLFIGVGAVMRSLISARDRRASP